MLPVVKPTVLNHREVLLIISGCVLAFFAAAAFKELTVGRRLRRWAQSQGLELVSWEFPPLASYFHTAYLFTVRDPLGNRRTGRVRFVGGSMRSEGLAVEWLPDQQPHEVSLMWRVIAIVLVVTAAVLIWVQVFSWL
jgi:hypothetical protein